MTQAALGLMVSVPVAELLKFSGVLCQHCVGDIVDIVLENAKGFKHLNDCLIFVAP